MADKFQVGSENWWDTSRNRFEGIGTTAASISTTLNSMPSFEWPTEMGEVKSRSTASMVLQGSYEQSSTVDGSGGGVLPNHNLQMMGLGINWNQSQLGEKSESSFRCMLQEDLSSNACNFQKESSAAASSQENWRHKLYSDQPQFRSLATTSFNDSSTISSHNLATDAYGMFMSENQRQNTTYENRPMNYTYDESSTGCDANAGHDLMSSWNKFPQFLRTSPPPSATSSSSSHLHFTNNTPSWNASAPTAAMNDDRSSFFQGLQTQIPAPPSFDEKPKRTSEIRDLGTTAKKNSTETSNKRSRGNETPSTLPAFKVRKEKMGDRITALQQLISPFGKTDTASVLSEAFEYIKFLHEQVCVLSTPYMKNGVPIQHQQILEVEDTEGARQDLRSQGLCLVPVPTTFPVTHETTVDFWTPTFGGTFR